MNMDSRPAFTSRLQSRRGNNSLPFDKPFVPDYPFGATMAANKTEAFVQATLGVFENLFGLLPGAGAPVSEMNPSLSGEISGVIDISGAYEGAMVVSFPQAVLFKLCEKVDGKAPESMNDEVADMVGEIANMIAGNARRILENVEISISTPRVIREAGQGFEWPFRASPVVQIPFTVEKGSFGLAVNLK